MQIQKVTLTGPSVRLEPLAAEHLPALATVIADGNLWQLPVTFVPQPQDLPTFLQQADAAFAASKELTFVIVDSATSTVVGSTRFRCIDSIHRRVEIGFTFIGEKWQRSHINTQAKYLMLCHAFDTWGCHRVELLTDERNLKSRSAILRIGATFEGILRSHMVMRDGFIRNSVIYSITSSDWPEIKIRLAVLMRPLST